MHSCACGHSPASHDSTRGPCCAVVDDDEFGRHRCPCPVYELDDVA